MWYACNYYLSLPFLQSIEYDTSQSNQEDVERLRTAYTPTLRRSFIESWKHFQVLVVSFLFCWWDMSGKLPPWPCLQLEKYVTLFFLESKSSAKSNLWFIELFIFSIYIVKFTVNRTFSSSSLVPLYFSSHSFILDFWLFNTCFL
jgi:hypothetical protein